MKYEILSSKEATDKDAMMHVRDDNGTFTITVRPERNDDECFEVDISFDNDSYRLPAGIEQDDLRALKRFAQAKLADFSKVDSYFDLEIRQAVADEQLYTSLNEGYSYFSYTVRALRKD